MEQVQIRSKKVRIAVMDGEKQIGEISFNPDDTRVYSRFAAILRNLTEASKQDKKIDLSKYDDLFELVEGDDGTQEKQIKGLEEIEDLDKASEYFGMAINRVESASDAYKGVFEELDALFGEGICELFTGGEQDADLLMPLFDAVAPYFQKSRENKVSPFLRKK